MKCFFWGATGQAKVLYELIEGSNIKLYYLFDNNSKLKYPIGNIPIIGGWNQFLKMISAKKISNFSFAVAIGGEKGKERLELQEKIKSFGLTPLTLIHKHSYVARNVRIGEGSQILVNSTVCTDVSMGKACIINTAAQIDHESILGDGVHIGPGAKLAGCVKVGNFSFVGIGAIVLPRIKIGKNVIIGAGSIVTKDIPDNTVAYGIPAVVKK